MIKQTTEKEKQIAIILGILEESHRGKEWIISEIKKKRLKISINDNMNSYDVLNSCPTEFHDSLLHTLRGLDIIMPDGIETKIYHWFFSDIVAGSNPSIPTNAQVKKIIVLNKLISQTDAFKNRDPGQTIILPTGDGMAIGFGDNPERPLLLSIQLHKELAKYNATKRGDINKLLLRIGIESGPVYFVKDLEGKDNVWGPGIILTRRVMDLAGDMQIYAATRIAPELVKISEKYKEMLHYVQTYKTKYGEKIYLYNVYGDGFGLKEVQQKAKKRPISELQNLKKTSSAFAFDKIEIQLDVKDGETMNTHHRWRWEIINTSKEDREKIFYFIEGQVPKEFDELNVKVTTENGKELKIDSVSLDRPTRKEFYVFLDKPVKPKDKAILELQFDWDTPDRKFVYRSPSMIKKFSYICTLPPNFEIKSKVLKVDTDAGLKVHANPPPTVKKLNDKTAITWEKTNIPPQDAYQFQW